MQFLAFVAFSVLFCVDSSYEQQLSDCNNTAIDFLFAASFPGAIRLFVSDGYFEVTNNFTIRTGPHDLLFGVSSPVQSNTKLLQLNNSPLAYVCDNLDCLLVDPAQDKLIRVLSYGTQELDFARFTLYSSKERIPDEDELRQQLGQLLQRNVTESIAPLGIAFNGSQIFNLIECTGILYGLPINVEFSANVPISLLDIITYGDRYYLYGNPTAMYCIVEHFNQNSNKTELCSQESIRVGNLFDCPFHEPSFVLGRALAIDFSNYVDNNSSSSFNYTTSTDADDSYRKWIIIFSIIIIVSVVVLVVVLLNCTSPIYGNSSSKMI